MNQFLLQRRKEALQNRLRKAIDEGMETEAIPIVFPNAVGKHQTRSGLSNYTWYLMRDAASIGQDDRFHDLRHSHASFMIAAGIHIKIIQERLGHATFKLTADTYSHLLQSAQADAVERVDELFQKPAENLVAVKHDSYRNEESPKPLRFKAFRKRGRRDSNPQPPDRQSGTLTN